MRTVSFAVAAVSFALTSASAFAEGSAPTSSAAPAASAAPSNQPTDSAAVTAARGPAPTSAATEYSALESRLIDRTVAARRAQVDPAPEGKRIESVVFERLDVFDDEDPIPKFFNVFHTVTLPRVVRRELLVREGDAWTQVLVDETTRNLRALPQLSLAIAVPLVGSAPDRVRLLVITRDVWSLRMQWDVEFIGGRINYLLIQPTEENVAGTHHQPQLVYQYQPLSWTLGAAYAIPRIGDSHVGVTATAGLVFPQGELPGRASSESLEGGYATASIGRPLYSSLTEWGWSVAGAYRNYVFREYQNGELKLVRPDGSSDVVPYQYRQKSYSASAGVTRSFGWAHKQDLTLGVAGSSYRYTLEGVDALDPQAVALFSSQRLPVGEDRVYPFVRGRFYQTDYFRTIDVESLSVQEDFRLGYDVYAQAAPVLPPPLSTRSLVALTGGAMWTSRMGDGLLRASVEGNVEVQTDGGAVRDAMVDAKLGIVSPRTPLGRLVFGARAIERPANYLRRTELLGGDSRLRGYPSALLYGNNLLAINAEFRTRGFYWLGMAFGGVAFYDSGDAFSDPHKLSFKHSVGAGLRFLFPFFDEVAYRLDVAVPLNASALPSGAPPVDFIFSLEQAFAFPELCANASGLQVARQCP